MNSAAQTTKTLAQKIAKQMAQEPLEMLKSARTQVTGQEFEPDNNQVSQDEQLKQNHERAMALDSAKSSRLIEAFQREIDDIRKQDLLKLLQKKISEGEEVPLEDYPELSIEHKQVLNAQMEAVKVRIANQQAQQNSAGFQESASKKGRKMFNFGKKTAVKREQTHVEKVMPPSG